MTDIASLTEGIKADFETLIERVDLVNSELTVIVPAKHIRQVCLMLRDQKQYHFDMLIDICGVDYLHYGKSEWETNQATRYGFERGVKRLGTEPPAFDLAAVTDSPLQRFAVVYHLLSIKHNHRIRLRTFLNDNPPVVDSVQDIWKSADWFEREAFDLYGILFDGHADLRRILTDYGFIGHPFRKDFPLSGHVEVRYDKDQERVIYEPVDIEPRVLTPKIIRSNKHPDPSVEKKNV
ncbi:MAG: nuoC [Gammaproteobacteria bacterium]|nr:nuoC [Gammaproteobacteria bacterium]